MGYKDTYKEAKKAGEIENLVPKFLEFRTPKEMVVGLLIDFTKMKGKLSDTPYNQYLLETDDGLVKLSLGAAADAEFSANMKRGEVYAITFIDKEDIGGGKKINRYLVEHIPGAGRPVTDNPDDHAF